ncbi:hypothetical protein UAJ10_12015 [Nitrospirillum sp. BR 11164]|uniref:hypothetical protein n=1 Tax=Nitrospirillum sp. BR 11164 TaxID=3104324 RepID=UPI002AFE9363|nr:hypothetical protein [Nitrospirillum sp. BR 11164]MEA1649736.1 hypothetical protein [Nitrospirillum sp. BR 11164]
MVETRPTTSRPGGLIPDGSDRRSILVPPPAPTRAVQKAKPGNRWPSARELAGLMVNGILTLPARYRRGMFLDVLI